MLYIYDLSLVKKKEEKKRNRRKTKGQGITEETKSAKPDFNWGYWPVLNSLTASVEVAGLTVWGRCTSV